jgi:hypothetical protein
MEINVCLLVQAYICISKRQMSKLFNFANLQYYKHLNAFSDSTLKDKTAVW